MNHSQIRQSCIQCILCLVLVIFIGPAALAEPDWIWAGARTAEARVLLRHTFQMDEEARSARLRMVADFAFAELSINGKPAAAAEAYGPVVELDVSAVEPGDVPSVVTGLVVFFVAQKRKSS